MQGCPFRCYNCFNPETWDFNGGKEWNEETKKLFMELADRPYIKRISILGGEPLADENVDGVQELVNEMRILFPQKALWLYTGYMWEEIMIDEKRCKIASNCDVVVDGRYVDNQRDLSLRWRGSKGQRVIDVRKSIDEDRIIFYEI